MVLYNRLIHIQPCTYTCGNIINNNDERSACGVIVIVVGNEHGDTSSNPGRDWLHFT